jgi:hypothetical protein
MLARKPGRLFIPTQGTPHAGHFIRRHGFAVPGTAEDYSTFAFPLRHRLRGRSNEEGIIDRFLAEGAEIRHLVTKLPEQFFYFFLVTETGVISPKRDFHPERF